LLEQGHDVHRVADVDPCMIDSRVLQWAWREKRVIITTDQDFEEMVWLEKKQHYGILRLENLPRVERLSLLEYVLSHHSQELASGNIIIATSRKIRIRSW
jgi:predicted nuclease of predicted toxin-antitoxin system